MAKFTDKQIADVADSLFIEAPHEAELLKKVIPSLMTKMNALEGSGSSSAAEDISYEAPETGVLNESDNVQDALDAVNTVFTEFTASNLVYDNETSNLESEDVQAAIDEVVTMIPEVPTEYAAEDITYTNAATPSVVEVAGALDVIVDIVRGNLLSKIVVTVPNTSNTVALTADPSLIDGQIISIVPVSGAESIITGSSIDGTGILTVTLAAAQAADDAVFNVYVQKVIPD